MYSSANIQQLTLRQVQTQPKLNHTTKLHKLPHRHHARRINRQHPTTPQHPCSLPHITMAQVQQNHKNRYPS